MKGILCLLLALSILCPVGLAETYCINYEGTDEVSGYALLLTDDGEELTPAQTYSRIYALNPEEGDEAARRYQAEPMEPLIDADARTLDEMDYYAYHRVALMADDGRLLTGFDYCGLTWLSDDNVACAVYDHGAIRTGVMDADGNVILEAKYADVRPLGDGQWLTLVPMRGDEQYAVVLADAEGGEADLGLTTGYGWLAESGDGPLPVQAVSEYGDKCVYIDQDGLVCFDRTFEWAEPFYGEFAEVRDGDFMGLIDREGQLVLPMEYDYIFHGTRTPADYFIAERGTELSLIDAQTGKIAMTHDFAPSDYISGNLNVPGLLWVYTDQGEYLLQTDGTQLATFPEGDTFYQLAGCDALRVIESAGEYPDFAYRLVDLEGNQYGGVYAGLTDGLAQEGPGRFVASTCKVYEDRNGEAFIDWSSFRYGVIDENGAEILPIRYSDYIQVLAPDRFWVVTPEKTGMIDAEGNWYYAINSYETLMD